jgi:uncharacterized membrane protein YeaQ/YmgE (transglycosylase-associated protein family)
MGIIAWIILGLAAGLLGGWLATKPSRLHTLNGFFSLSTWLTAIVGAAVLLLGCHLATGRPDHRTARG